MQKGIGLILAVALAGCARVLPPSGGEQDREPPRVIETDPEPDLVATEFVGSNRPVRIVFSETLSERSPREMVQVSPETGEVRADRDGNVIEVTIDGGWRAGRVYRVTVLPGIVDRRGNARTTAYELVFSTGGTIHQNALGGIAVDRITGRPAANARVEARSRADTTTVYSSVSDSAGFFALRSLPVGDYTTTVYVDQNRNRTLDRAEARATQEVAIGTSDTVAIELALLGTDTTPARLLRADIRDSLQVRLNFDDYMEATAPLETIAVTVWQLPDSTLVPGGRLLTPRAFQAARADTTRPVSPRLPAAPDTTALPVNELVFVPGRPLLPNTRYRFNIANYVNLHGLLDGGGSVAATAPAPPRTPPAARDTAAAPRDTTVTPRDTTSVR